MTVRIYVGNLPFKSTDEEVKALFSQFGEVESADIIRYRESKRSKGYAFVVMNEDSVDKVIEELNESELDGRPLKVRVANDRMNFPGGRKDSKKRVDSIRFAID